MSDIVVFDIGETLVQYNKILNWKELYRLAFERASEYNKKELK